MDDIAVNVTIINWINGSQNFLIIDEQTGNGFLLPIRTIKERKRLQKNDALLRDATHKRGLPITCTLGGLNDDGSNSWIITLC